MIKTGSKWLAGILFSSALLACTQATAQDSIRIGIANFGEHSQLNIAIEGFKKALTEAGYEEGKDVVYTVSHTNFDASLVPQMIAKLQAEQPKLIFTVTTPVSQIAQKALAGTGIPIVFTAVTDPVAAKLVPSWEEGGDGITGSSDLQDLAAVMKFTKELIPNATRFGIPYNPGEANDVALVESARELAKDAGFEIVAVGVNDVNEIQQRVASFAGKADLIYVPTSNLLQPAVAAVAAAARQAGIPIVNSDDGAVRNGVVPASFAVNYDKVGENAGKIAVRILQGEPAASIPPSKPAYEDHVVVISRSTAEAFGFEVPDTLAGCGCFVN